MGLTHQSLFGETSNSRRFPPQERKLHSNIMRRLVAVAIFVLIQHLSIIVTVTSAFVAVRSRASNDDNSHRLSFPSFRKDDVLQSKSPTRRIGVKATAPLTSSTAAAAAATVLFAIRGGSSSDNTNNDELSLRTVLVTGGTGYIGSHTCLELISTGRYRVIAIDNLINSSEESLVRVKRLLRLKNDTSNNDDDTRLMYRNCDIRDGTRLQQILHEFPTITSCIHFAGLKAVGESVSKPLDYYNVNIGGTTTLLQQLSSSQIYKFVFSSSATVYGEPEMLPLLEHAKLSATNPYGRTKLFIEEILRDVYASNPSIWNILILRYFNPIGAHPSGIMGEDPQGIPNNLMPFIAQVCVGRRDKLSIFGNDYDTLDGTGVRDYIHVVDLAKGHVAALDKLYDDDAKIAGGGYCESVNLGTGHGVSVLELVEGMAQATGKPVPYFISDRRPGDVAQLYADATKAKNMLGWSAQLGTKEMCEDTWRWQSTNPMGYKVEEVKEEIVSEN
jgi:UDP-glucose 4-epimerase